MIELRRMWINQPSTHQPYHAMHGKHVLAGPTQAFTCQVFFLSGDTISQQMPELALSAGWPAPMVHIEVVPHAEVANTLERLIDCVTLGRTIAALADVCYAKAEHVRGNWQDRALALQWDIAAKRLEKANEGVIEL